MAIFHSPLILAHHYWDLHLSAEDTVIDATCGNGKDTLFLAKKVLPKGKVLAIDIQKTALENTQVLLHSHFSKEDLLNVHFFHQSHSSFPKIAYQEKVSLIVYNLGYLPGGDKNLTTECSSTLVSIQNAMELLSVQGAVSITCYPGHEEGAKEEEMLTEFLQSLAQNKWQISHHRWTNREKAPSLYILKKIV